MFKGKGKEFAIIIAKCSKFTVASKDLPVGFYVNQKFLRFPLHFVRLEIFSYIYFLTLCELCCVSKCVNVNDVSFP